MKKIILMLLSFLILETDGQAFVYEVTDEQAKETIDACMSSPYATLPYDGIEGEVDNLSNCWESGYFKNWLNIPFWSIHYKDQDDPDNDGYSNYVEYKKGTNPTLASSTPNTSVIFEDGVLIGSLAGDYVHQGRISTGLIPGVNSDVGCQVDAGESASLMSLSQIVLKPGFHAKSDSNFTASIFSRCPSKKRQGTDLCGMQPPGDLVHSVSYYTEVHREDFVEVVVDENDLNTWAGYTSNICSGNSCYYDFLKIDSPTLTQVDALGCLQIACKIQIKSENITNLNGLNQLEEVGDDFIIKSNKALPNLSGLHNLTMINGDLVIEDNDALQDIAGFNNLTTLYGDLIIKGNAALKDIKGFNNLEEVHGELIIENNELLQTISGFNNLKTVSGQTSISSNPALLNLKG